MKYIALATLIFLAGCATTQAADPAPSDPSNLPLLKFTHDDLKSAAAYATANGYPARAAVYSAIEAQLTACEQAASTLMPKPLPDGTKPGLFTSFEIGAEAIGGGIPAAVKLNCSIIQLPTGALGLLR